VEMQEAKKPACSLAPGNVFQEDWRGGKQRNCLQTNVHILVSYEHFTIMYCRVGRFFKKVVMHFWATKCIRSLYTKFKAFLYHTVIRFLVSAKFGTCTVVSANGTQVEDKMSTFKGECAQFSFNRCPIYTQLGANAKFSTNSQETDNSAVCVDNLKFLSFKLKHFSN
jgi:hypothetical protein